MSNVLSKKKGQKLTRFYFIILDLFVFITRRVWGLSNTSGNFNIRIFHILSVNVFDKRFTKLFAFTVMQVQKVVIEGQSSDTDPSEGSDQYDDENGRENAHHSHYQGEHVGHISRGTRQLQHYFVVLFSIMV